MAANDDITRLHAENEELRDEVDDLEEEKEELRGAVHSLDKKNMRLTHTARQDRVARLRAEDQAVDERDHRLAVEQDFHRRSLDFMGVVPDAAKAARVSPVPGTANADATPSEAAVQLPAPQEGIAFRSDLDVAALLALAIQHARQAKDAELAGKAAAQREKSARALVNRSQEEKNFAGCRQAVAMALLDATRQVFYRRTGSETYECVKGYVRHINSNLPRGAAQLNRGTAQNLIRVGWALVHAHGSTELGNAKIGRDQLDREKWSKITSSNANFSGNHAFDSPLAEMEALEFVLGDGFEADLLDKLRATGKSATALVKEATGKSKHDYFHRLEERVEARKAEAANLEKQIAAEDSEIAQLRQKLAELEEYSQAGGGAPPPAN